MSHGESLPRKIGHRIFNDPALAIFLIGFLSAIVFNSGDLQSDTEQRLQVTRSWWTSEPEVLPKDYPQFGLKAPDGKLRAWYGMGQSIVMLPSDLIAAGIVKVFHASGSLATRIRQVVVCYLTFPLIAALGLLAVYRLLRLLELSDWKAFQTSVLFLFTTTFLQWSVNANENSTLFLLSVSSYNSLIVWFREGKRRSLAIAACLMGFAVLHRLTMGIDVIAQGIFVGMLLWINSRNLITRINTRQYLLDCVKVAVPILLVALAIDRIYHHHRFGTYLGTYFQIMGEQYKLTHTITLPNFPYEFDFWTGITNELFSPQYSILLFEPFIVIFFILACVLILRWRNTPAKAVAVDGQTVIFAILALSVCAMLVGYLIFYARVGPGWASWGPRYLTTPCQLLALFALYLIVKQGREWSTPARTAFWLVGTASLIVQLASITLTYNLELSQLKDGSFSFVIGRRFVNIAAIISGKFQEWNLGFGWWTSEYNNWRYLPFRTAKFLPRTVEIIVVCVWVMLLMTLIAYLIMMLRRARMHSPIQIN